MKRLVYLVGALVYLVGALVYLVGALVAFHSHNSTDHAAGPDMTDDPLAGVIRWSQGRGRHRSPQV